MALPRQRRLQALNLQVCLPGEVDRAGWSGTEVCRHRGRRARGAGSQAAEAGSLACSWGCWRTRGWVETLTIEEEHTGALTAFLLPFLFLPPRPRGAVPWSLGGGLHPRRVAARKEGWGWGCGGWRTPRAPPPPPSSLAASPPAPCPSSSSFSPSSPSSSWYPAAAVRGAAGGGRSAFVSGHRARRAQRSRPRGDGGGCEDWQSWKNGRGAGPASRLPLSPTITITTTITDRRPSHYPASSPPPISSPRAHCQLCQTISFASGNTWTDRSRVSAAAVGCSSHRPLGCLGFPVRERGLRCCLCLTRCSI